MLVPKKFDLKKFLFPKSFGSKNVGPKRIKIKQNKTKLTQTKHKSKVQKLYGQTKNFQKKLLVENNSRSTNFLEENLLV